MRIDCYNACETDILELEYGDTCYYLGRLWIKVNAVGVPMKPAQCVLVALNNGDLIFVENETCVILADTKVIANTKDIQF